MLLRERGTTHFIVGLGIGLAAGCLIGLLYAPQAGRRTRRKIVAALEDGANYVKSRAEDADDYVHREASHLHNEVGKLVERGKALLEESRTSIESTLEAGAKLYRQATR
jgi:gas vesicle protein